MTDLHSTGSGSVLLLGGPSGVGKSTVSKNLARRLGIGWVQVDDLRLALQWSKARLPADRDTQALRYFLDQPSVWDDSPEQLCEGLIAVGRAMANAIGVVVSHHCVQADSAIIEGDAIFPELLNHPLVQPHVAANQIALAIILPDHEESIRQSIISRNREPDRMIESSVRMNWLFTNWLRNQATAHNVPTVSNQPMESLADRIQQIWFQQLGPEFPP